METTHCDPQWQTAQCHQCKGTYITTAISGVSRPAKKGFVRLPPSAEAHEIRLPALRCSFPSLLHPLYKLVKKQCDGWIVDVAQPSSPAARRLLLHSLLPRLICRNMATSPSVRRLVHVVKMISWLIIADDNDDHPDALGRADNVTSSHIITAAEVLSILRHRPSCSTGNADQYASAKSNITLSDRVLCPGAAAPAPTLFRPVREHLPVIIYTSKRREKRDKALLALAALWDEMHAEMGERLCARFVSSMEDYFDAVKVQAAYRKAGRIPDIEAYKEIRRQASFILSSLVLMEYALGIELDDATYAQESLKQLRNTVTDHIWLCNDLVSCRAKIGVGDYFNMPSIVYSQAQAPHDKGWTLQGALDSVAQMTQDLDVQCLSMLKSIDERQLIHHLYYAGGSSSSASSLTIETYVEGLSVCMAGTLAWHLETARYALMTDQ